MAPLVLKKKLAKVQGLRTDGPQMLEALDSLSTFYDADGRGNTAEARRNLHGDLEDRALQLVDRFLVEFEPIHDRIQVLNSTVGKMNAVCDGLAEELAKSSERTSRFNADIGALVKKRKEVSDRAKVMDAFMDRFKLSNVQLAALREGPQNADGGATFFSVLDEVRRIREECQGLINSQFQSAGLEVFEATAIFQDQAYEQLYGWVQDQCLSLDGDFPEASDALCKGLSTLMDAPAYHEHARDCIADTRATSLSKRFAIALTQGGSHARPIEMHAHDPLRYVGDMLAWIHQSLAVEKNLVFKLFSGNQAPRQQHQAQGGYDDDSTEPPPPKELLSVEGQNYETLNKIFSGVAPSLTGRVRQVFEIQPPLVAAFKLYNLLDFYRVTLRSLLGGDSNGLTSATLESLLAEASQLFFDSIRTQCSKLLASPPAYPRDLSVALEVSELIRRLSDILEVHNDSIGSNHQVSGGESGQEHERKKERFAPVLNAFIEPLLQGCRASASGLDRSDHAVYLLNNLLAIQSSLTRYDFTSEWVQRLAEEIGDWSDILVKDQADKILRSSGLTDKIEIVHRTGGQRLVEQAGMDMDSLKQALDSFYKSLFSLAIPEFDRLQSPRLRASARTQTAQTVASTYLTFYTALFDTTTSGYTAEQLNQVFLHSPEQVRQLLDV